MTAQRRLTAEDYARIAAMNAPTPKVIARVFAGYLSQDAVKLHEFLYNGFIVRIWESPYCPGQLLVCADPAVPSEPPAPSRSEEVADLAAARVWVKGLGNYPQVTPVQAAVGQTASAASGIMPR